MYLDILVETLIEDERLFKLNTIREKAEVSYLSSVATMSKKGFAEFKRFLKSLSEKQHIIKNDVKQTTVWEKIKKLEEKKP